MTPYILVMTGLDPVIHEPRFNLRGDGRNKSGHDEYGARDSQLRALIVVRT